jgi:hypothetical protein
MSSNIVERLPFPLYTIDFEASGLGQWTYPVEVGVAWWPAPDAGIESWSTLIRPTIEWQESFVWSDASQAVHGIEPRQLAEGMSPKEALEAANTLIGANPAFCDGGEHDVRWLRHLEQAADIGRSFWLADWHGLASLLSPEQQRRMIEWRGRERVLHRAAADAAMLVWGIAIGLGVKA